MNMTTIWLIVFVACVAIEIVTMGLTTIWFAGGSLMAAGGFRNRSSAVAAAHSLFFRVYRCWLSLFAT